MKNRNVKNRIRLAIDALEKAYSNIIAAKQLSDNYYELVHFQTQLDNIASIISELKGPVPIPDENGGN